MQHTTSAALELILQPPLSSYYQPCRSFFFVLFIDHAKKIFIFVLFLGNMNYLIYGTNNVNQFFPGTFRLRKWNIIYISQWFSKAVKEKFLIQHHKYLISHNGYKIFTPIWTIFSGLDLLKTASHAVLCLIEIKASQSTGSQTFSQE